MLKINESIMIPKEKESQGYLLQIQLLMENEVNFAGMRGLFTMIFIQTVTFTKAQLYSKPAKRGLRSLLV